jgi:hypothetical protein
MYLPIHKEIHVFGKTDGQTVQDVDIIYTQVRQITEYKSRKKVDAPGLSEIEKGIVRDMLIQQYYR